MEYEGRLQGYFGDFFGGEDNIAVLGFWPAAGQVVQLFRMNEVQSLNNSTPKLFLLSFGFRTSGWLRSLVSLLRRDRLVTCKALTKRTVSSLKTRDASDLKNELNLQVSPVSISLRRDKFDYVPTCGRGYLISSIMTRRLVQLKTTNKE